MVNLVKNQFKQVNDERYSIIMARFAKFQAAMNGVDLDVVQVFDPLPQKLIDELNLIREVSKDLQQKKQEDINKAAQAEVESKKEIEEAAVETPEGNLLQA